MKILVSILLVFCQSLGFAQTYPSLNLMPVPKALALGNGRFALVPGFTVSVMTEKTDLTLLSATNRMFSTLNRRTGLYFKQQYIDTNSSRESASLVIRTHQRTGMTIGVDESYQLVVGTKQIRLEASTTIGALRGLQTLLQLLDRDNTGFYFPEISIQDAPRFAWRGLMIDVARHFIPAEVIKRNIEAMAAVKMNVLHLHLSDDEGFRVESKRFPLLQEKGSNGQYYTQAEIKEIIVFAQARGIIVVPEFDIPGHTTSWLAGYPELATKPGPYIPGSPYHFDRSKPFDLMQVMQTVQNTAKPTFQPTKESVYAFLDQFFGEMANLFTGPYVHIGADENNGLTWKQDSLVSAFMRENHFNTPGEMQAYFVNKVCGILAKYGKKTIGWNELFTKTLPKDVIVQVWSPMSPPNIVGQILEQGNPVILSKGIYLDHFFPAYIHYNLQFPSEEILGGEAAQWTEIADAENIETRIWPRMAAVAERFWSPKTVRQVQDMYRRLFIISDELAESGLMHQANYDRMVRRFADGYNVKATKELLDVLTPVKGYKRLFGNWSLPESYVYPNAPMVRAADIAMVDPEDKWTFRNLVADYLLTKNASSVKAIREQLTIWSVCYQQLKPLFDSSPLAKEIEPHAKNLSALSQSCLEAMDIYQSGKQPGNQWMADQQTLMKTAARSVGDVELSVLPELNALISHQLTPLPESYSLF